MNGIKTTTAILLALAAYTLLANPAPAEPVGTSAPAGCTGDYVCGEDTSVVATWPLQRWDTVRKAEKQVASPREQTPPGGITSQ